MIPSSDITLKLLIDKLKSLMEECLGNFYDQHTEIFIEPIVLLAMLHEIHYFHLVLAQRFVDVSDCEREAINYLSEGINDLMGDIVNMSKNNNEKKGLIPWKIFK